MGSEDSREGRNDSVSLADEDAVKKILIDSVLGLWETVNNLTRLRPSRRDRYRVTIFGSARAKPGSFTYEETKLAGSRTGQAWLRHHHRWRSWLDASCQQRSSGSYLKRAIRGYPR